MICRLAPLGLPLLLAGCFSLTPQPPRALLTLTPAVALPPGSSRSAGAVSAVTIQLPTFPQALATVRVPVITGQTVAYVRDVAWIELPSRQFARLLSETVTAKTGRIVLASSEAFGRESAQLGGELRSFGVDGATREAVVTYDAALIRSDGAPLEKKRFEARLPVAAIDAASVGPALNQAANQVAGEVTDWLGR